MLTAKMIIVDRELWGVAYTFEFAGDDFPVHVHNEDDIHITVLAYGAVRCKGRPEIEGKVLKAKPGGTIINWKIGEPHGFVALEDGTTLVNMLKKRQS
jgi:quercetin dioxygenase-like cupin family protein